MWQSDSSLIQGVRAGDEAALSALYQRHAPYAFALARRLLPPGSDHERTVQTAFLAIWHGAQPSPAASAPAWVRDQIARAVCRDRRAAQVLAPVTAMPRLSLDKLSAKSA